MRDLHMHTVFSDGKDMPEEMVLAALDKGLTCVGISDHSHAPSDPWGMPLEKRDAYREELLRLRAKYADRIEILCGLERDFYCDDDREYDYTIGSVHALRMKDGSFLYIDWSAEKLAEGVRAWFGGDWYAMTEAYYDKVGRVAETTGCDIIGHFDLVTKFIEQQASFDLRHPRYQTAWKRAADRLLKTGKPFEINTGAISRGYRTTPYPDAEIVRYLRERGGKLLLSCDSHQKETISFQFDRWSSWCTDSR